MSVGLKRLVGIALCACLPAGAFAQLLYRYQDENGVWVYADRAPDTGVAVESVDLGIAPATAEVKLLRRDDGLGTAIIAANTFWSPVQVAYEVLEPLNVAVANGGSLRGNRILEPRSETFLLDLVPILPTRATSFDMTLQ